jgi:large subunit ribosomal protein LP0
MKGISDYKEKTKKLPAHLNNELLDSMVESLSKIQVLLICANCDLSEITQIINQFLVEKQGKTGQLSPCEIIIPAGPTGMDSSQIEYFQALKIPTKVARNQLEITAATKILVPGQKISLSEINLMKKFNIKPFKHTISIEKIYMNGKIYDKSILKITPAYMKEKLELGIKNLLGLSIAAHIPTKVSAPYIFAEGFKNICAMSFATNHLISAVKNMQASAEEPKEEKKSKKEEEKPKKEEKKVEEEDDDVGFADLF